MATVIGITGGIASGKSTVSQYLLEKGNPVIDADQVVHNLQAKGGRLYEALLVRFGSGILDETGELDRPGLGQLVFSDKAVLQELSLVQDEVIRQALLEERNCLVQEHELVFMDIPLLFEAAYQETCDQIWLVYVPESVQLDRLMERNGYSQEEAAQRLAAQWPIEDKKGLAHVVIDNQGERQETYDQLETLLAQLERR